MRGSPFRLCPVAHPIESVLIKGMILFSGWPHHDCSTRSHTSQTRIMCEFDILKLNNDLTVLYLIYIGT